MFLWIFLRNDHSYVHMNFWYKWSFKYSYEFFILMIIQLLIWINKSYKWSFKCSNEFLGVTSSSRSDNVTLHVCPFVCKSPYFLGTMAPLHFAPLPICSFTPLVVGGWWWLEGATHTLCNTWISLTAQFSIFGASASSLIQRLTFQFVCCRSFQVRRRPCSYKRLFKYPYEFLPHSAQLSWESGKFQLAR